jgi:hypothetical protein
MHDLHPRCAELEILTVMRCVRAASLTSIVEIPMTPEVLFSSPQTQPRPSLRAKGILLCLSLAFAALLITSKDRARPQQYPQSAPPDTTFLQVQSPIGATVARVITIPRISVSPLSEIPLPLRRSCRQRMPSRRGLSDCSI